MFRKKKNSGLLSEVDDSRQMVYDFRRRTQLLFENYRAVGYKKPPTYDLENMKDEDAEVMEKLIFAHAVDSANDDCLIEKILGPVRAGICYLEDQALEHMDFYTRQSERCIVDSKDISRLLEFWRGKEAAMSKEYARTMALWNEYCGYTDKEV